MFVAYLEHWKIAAGPVSPAASRHVLNGDSEVLMWMLAMMMSLTAQADDCDTRALSKELRGAGPADAAAVFVTLADCDEDLAKREAPFAFDDMNANPEGFTAMVRGVKLGASGPVQGWIDGLQSDSRSLAISALGKVCKESEEVQSFFIGQAESLGKEFWDQRWYKGLSNCGVESIKDLLS